MFLLWGTLDLNGIATWLWEKPASLQARRLESIISVYVLAIMTLGQSSPRVFSVWLANLQIRLEPWVNLRTRSGGIYAQWKRKRIHLAKEDLCFNDQFHYLKVTGDSGPLLGCGEDDLQPFGKVSASHLLKAAVSLTKKAGLLTCKILVGNETQPRLRGSSPEY